MIFRTCEAINDAAGARSVHRTGSQLTVGGVLYTWDAMGRVVGTGDWTFSYDAHGQLDHASRPVSAKMGFPDIGRIVNGIETRFPMIEWIHGNVYDPVDGVTPLNW